MDNFNEIIKAMMSDLREDLSKQNNLIPVGISNRHIHLSKEDLEKLYGKDYELNPIKDLSQPGQYAAKETLIACGPKGAIEGIRVLGPVRPKTQVEILQGDCFKLGIKAPVRMSGELEGSTGITLIGPKGSVYIQEGTIIAKRHIHMTLEDAGNLGVQDGDIVSIEILGNRGGILNNVAVRANNASQLECHLDTEEANALGLTSCSKVIIKK